MQVLDAPRVDALAERVRTVPLWAHAAAMLVVLVALMPVVNLGAVFSADEGAAIIQARRVADEGAWVGSHPLPQLDPELVEYPVHLAEETSEGWHELTRHPAYIHVLAVAWTLGGFPLMVLISVLATVGAALVAGDLAGRLEPRLAAPTLWVVGLASPLVFDSYLAIGHALGAFMAALAAWFLIGRWSSGYLVGGGLACAGGVLIRSEGVLLGLALGAVLVLVGLADRDRARLQAGLVAGCSSVGAYVFDGWWTAQLKTSTTGAAGQGISRFQGGLEGRWEGFKRTWLWIGRGGLSDGDELILVAVVLAVVAGVAIRRQAGRRAIAGLSAASAVAISVRLVMDPTAIIPGLLFAFPLLAVGLVLLSRRDLALGLSRGRDLVLTSALFSAAVVATQFSVGGTTEWGGRYFALALPLITPVVMAAVLDRADSLDAVTARRWLASLLVLSMAVSTIGLLGLRRTHGRTAELVATVSAGMSQAGPDPVVITDVNPLARWSWDLVDDGRWGLVATDDLADASSELTRAGIARYVYVGFLADDEIAELSRRHSVVAEMTPAFDDRWRVVVFG